MSAETRTSLLEEIRSEAAVWWREQPNKGLFVALLVPWILLFHFLGNITFGYIKTSSLFGWTYYILSTSPDDEHGLLIPFVVAALFWWKRRQLIEVPKQIWWPAVTLVGLALILHMGGFFVQQTRISLVAFFIGIYGLIGLVWGKEFMKRSFFPMFLFAFCVPLGSESERITFPLRLFATHITSLFSVNLFGINVIQDGTRISDPSGLYQYEVAAACSGIRSLTAIFAFSTIYAFMSFQKGWKRATIIAAAFPLAVISNVIRLLMIILAAEMFGQETGNYVHESSWLSLLPYIPGILGVIAIGYFLRERESKEPVTTPEREPQLV